MASASDILSMDHAELLSRKKSLTKNDLFEAIIQMKSTMHNASVSNTDAASFLTVLDAKLKERLDPFLEKVTSLSNEISALKQKTDALEFDLRKLGNVDDVLFSKVFDEFSERSRREKNIIVSGIDESASGTLDERMANDAERIAAMLRCVGSSADSVVDIRRLGKPGSGGRRLLRVTLSSTDSKFSVLRNAKLLRNDPDFRGVYINHDRTKMQQAQYKALREEVKLRKDLGEDPVIYRGKVVNRMDRRNFTGRF